MCAIHLTNSPLKIAKASRVVQKNSTDFTPDDHYFMDRALTLAKQGANLGEVPVGAVLVCEGQVVGEGFNQPIATHDATAHAEIVAIRQACQTLQNYRLPKGCVLYVTLEPCTMCLGAIIHARIDKVVFAATEPKAGVVVSQENLATKAYFNHEVCVEGGLLSWQAGQLLRDFFAQRRQQKSKNKEKTMSYPVITIDGPSGAGKGTLAYRLAQRLGFQLLDSGALYRIVGLAAFLAGLLTDEMVTTGQVGVDFDKIMGEFTQKLRIDFVVNDTTQAVDILLDGKPLTHDIRNETVGAYASLVAKLPSVRVALLDLQKNTANHQGVVADGRDMGTVVFPKADAKIFLTASSQARAKRRVAQLTSRGQVADFEQILADIIARDTQDQNRAIAPSRPADDALLIDSSFLSADEVFAKAWAFCQAKGLGS